MQIAARASEDSTLSPVGLDLDGLTSTTTDLAGCNQPDFDDGVDNAFATFMPPLHNGPASEPTLPDHLLAQHQVDAGHVALVLRVSDWNGTSTDACVEFALSGTSLGEPIPEVVGRAPILDGVTDPIRFDRALPLTARFSVPSGGGLGPCEMDCVDHDLPITIGRPTGRFRFSNDMANVVRDAWPTNENSSMLGGFVRYVGTDPGTLSVPLEQLIWAMDPDLWPTVYGRVMSALDLDAIVVDGAIGLTACSARDGGGSSADALSLALLISSVPLP